MKKFLKSSVTAVLVINALTGCASAPQKSDVARKVASEDIYGTDNKFIKVTTDATKKMVKFDLCSLVDRTKCVPIGKGFYSQAALDRLQVQEKSAVWRAGLLDLGILAATVATGGAAGFYAGGAIAGAAASGEVGIAIVGGNILGFVGGSAAGLGATGIVSSYVDTLNPAEQNDEEKVLSQKFRETSGDVRIDYDVPTFAGHLEKVLAKLDN